VDRRAAIALLAGAVVAVLFAAVATADGVHLADGAPSFARSARVVPPPPDVVFVESGERAQWEIPWIVQVILAVLIYGGLAACAAVALVYAWRRRPRLRWRRGSRQRPDDFEILADVAAAISADAEEQRAALHHGSPRNAIVACWLRLEAAVVAAGVTRDPADTSAELTQRVLASHHVEPVAIARLADLYREARFSEHPMGEDARRAAIESLDAVHDGLHAEASSAAVPA
jgi:hypothetical protein